MHLDISLAPGDNRRELAPPVTSPGWSGRHRFLSSLRLCSWFQKNNHRPYISAQAPRPPRANPWAENFLPGVAPGLPTPCQPRSPQVPHSSQTHLLRSRSAGCLLQASLWCTRSFLSRALFSQALEIHSFVQQYFLSTYYVQRLCRLRWRMSQPWHQRSSTMPALQQGKKTQVN